MRTKKASPKQKTIKRCGVFDRKKAKKDGKKAMDVLWTIANVAKSDLSVMQWEIPNYEGSLQRVEEELNSLTLPPGPLAVLDLPDEIG
jgi:hypothetical protein